MQGNLVHWFVGRLSSGGLRGCCWGQSKSKDRQPKAKTDLTLVVLCCVCTVLVFCKGPFYCVCARKLKVLSHLHQVSAKGRRKAAGAAATRRAWGCCRRRPRADAAQPIYKDVSRRFGLHSTKAGSAVYHLVWPKLLSLKLLHAHCTLLD